MTMITFVPATAESTFGVNIGGSPREEIGELYWMAQVHRETSVALESSGSLNGVECGLAVKIGEPLDPKIYRKAWDYAHGFIDWFGGDKPCLIVLHVSAATFGPLRELAERGRLPSVLITFKDDCGIKFGGSPDGDEVMWQNVKHKFVPVHAARFTYAFSSLE